MEEQKHMAKKQITLRIIGQKKGDIYIAVCLETDIFIQASSISEMKKKMADALTAYFKSFSFDEIEQGAFFRKAPMKYRAGWYLLTVVSFTGKILKSMNFNANYDPYSQLLKLA
jgi:hypothetical protein